MLINMVLPGAVESPVDKNTLLLLHGEDFIDSSIYETPLTNQGVTVSTAQSKFGGSSFYFNGSSRILFPNTGINFGSGDFTIDWWEYPTSNSAETRFSSEYTTNPDDYGGMLIGYLGVNLFVSKALSDGWSMVSYGKALNVSVSTWTHWALVRSGNTMMSYRNGVLFWSATVSGSVYCSNGVNMAAIGDYMANANSRFIGYIDELRISNVARWINDFIPPTEPYGSGSSGGGDTGDSVSFTYSGNYTDNRINGKGTVRLNTSGTLTVTGKAVTISATIVGGGGGGEQNNILAHYSASGGGGGIQTVYVTLTPGTYEIIIGLGGAGGSSRGTATAGGDTTAFGHTSTGGKPGEMSVAGGAGGTPNGASGAMGPSAGGAPNGGSSNGGSDAANSGGDGYVELTFI